MSHLYPCVYHRNGWCYLDPKQPDACVFGPCNDETPSNGDKIRCMSDFELARKMVEYEGTVKERTRYGGHKHTFYGPHGEECEDKYQAVALWYGWLMEPAEEAKHDTN